MSYSDFFADPPPEGRDLNFARLHAQYTPLIQGAVSKYEHNYPEFHGRKPERSELLQVASIALWLADQRFDESFCHGKNRDYVFQAFAKRVVRGGVADFLKSWSKSFQHEWLPQTDEPLDDIAPAETYEQIRKEMRALLRHYDSRFSPRERTFIELYVFNDWSVRQIAAHEGVSTDTVRTWKKQLRKKVGPLKEQLKHGK
ncbi:MAG: sigma-70 family RNA polymerase sigma factor [Sporolactobacillus sp.]|jgi:RNA polymerase sigma factor (sigma-70 family)|nr:sigma-70 family RNA polymerase sigma factor [Sporolactobacillus sp.]